jgi:hypothetical protein
MAMFVAPQQCSAGEVGQEPDGEGIRLAPVPLPTPSDGLKAEVMPTRRHQLIPVPYQHDSQHLPGGTS